MDEIDRKILRLLLRDATMSQREIAEAVSLSQNACWARLRKLHEAGIIRRTVVELDPKRIGLGVSVLMLIKTRHHSQDWIDAFSRRLQADEEVVEFFRIAGDFDYGLKILTRDIETFDATYKRLIQGADFETVTSYVIMGDVKKSGSQPLRYMLS